MDRASQADSTYSRNNAAARKRYATIRLSRETQERPREIPREMQERPRRRRQARPGTAPAVASTPRVARRRRQSQPRALRKLISSVLVMAFFALLTVGVFQVAEFGLADKSGRALAEGNAWLHQAKSGKNLTYQAKYGQISTASFDYQAAHDAGSQNPTGDLRTVLLKPASYPKEFLDGLSSNPELLRLVVDYPTKHSDKPAAQVGKAQVTHNGIPLIMQYDERWGYSGYGDSTVAISGCGPTVISMVAVGLTKNAQATPAAVARHAEKSGYYTNEGTSWSLMSEGCRAFGIKGTQLKGVNARSLKKQLKAGHPVIVSLKPGDFTRTGHFIVLTGLKDGKVVINDPYSIERSKKTWSFESLTPQIKSAWAMSRA